MHSENIKQVSTQQLKVRQISEDYLKIQENTQFLTHLVRYVSKRERMVFSQQNILLDLKSIASLLVQISYLLFTCYVKKTNIYISDRICHLFPHKKQMFTEICIEYILQKEFFTLRQEQQSMLLNYFKKYEFIGEVNQYNRLVSNLIYKLLQIVKSQKEKAKLPIDKMYIKQFSTLEQVVNNFLMPRLLEIKHPRVIILALQETEIFRQHSLLVKTMNNSLFSSIRNHSNKSIFLEIAKLEKSLISLKHIKSLQTQTEQAEKIIQQFFFMLLKHKIVTMEQSLNENPGEQSVEGKGKSLFVEKMEGNNKNTKKFFLGEVENVSNQERKYICKIIIYEKPFLEFSQKLMQTIIEEALNNYVRVVPPNPRNNKNKPSIGKNQFHIEYFSTKGLIIVKYITPIQLNIENTDIIMFQSNNIGYHWSNVAMEIIQKSQSKQVKKKQRFLALKTVSYINYSENPLFKILIMIDLVMLCAKIAEPQMRKSMVKSQDFVKMQQISRKVDHMIKIFVKKIERYYTLINEFDQKQKR